jgi:hypothetical protein
MSFKTQSKVGLSGAAANSQANLRAQQRALLAPASRWKKEWVKPSSLSGSSNYKVLKWIKQEDLPEAAEQPTEEQVTAAITGARTLLQPQSAAETPSTPLASGAATPATASALGPSALGLPGNSTLPPSEVATPSSSTAPDQMLPAQAGQSSATSDTQMASNAVDVTQSNAQEPESMTLDTIPGREDMASDAQVEIEQREHDVRIAPELIGEEGAASRAALGRSTIYINQTSHANHQLTLN